MPTLDCDNAIIHYEEIGSGEPIILIHGFTVDSGYWTETGVAPRLAERHRVVLMDMRGHGRSEVTGNPPGFNARSMGDDIDALANALKLESFHLLGHSTGGMVAVRYAMRRGHRLRSLLLLDTSSATSLVPQYDTPARQRFTHGFAQQFVGRGWEEICTAFRAQPGPLLSGLDQHPDTEELWETYEELVRVNDPATLAAFARAFFWDPDFRRQQLRQIPCPTLILVGEHDTVFRGPSDAMAEEIPDVRLVVLEGVGHMTAIEAPDRTIQEIQNFLRDPTATPQEPPEASEIPPQGSAETPPPETPPQS
jgi:pimeloyl-ACP methyl ester carboxylesterase